MLATLIQRYNKVFHLKNEKLTEILQAVMCHIYDCINNIYQYSKPFLYNKMSIFEEYGAFMGYKYVCFNLIQKWTVPVNLFLGHKTHEKSTIFIYLLTF